MVTKGKTDSQGLLLRTVKVEQHQIKSKQVLSEYLVKPHASCWEYNEKKGMILAGFDQRTHRCFTGK